jgi:hypothetical protein
MRSKLAPAIAGAVVLLLPLGASCDVNNPSNCDTWATGYWAEQGFPARTNCYVGNNASLYDRSGNYATGIQRILKAEGFYGGSIDGIFGSLSASATQNYQASKGLTADGVVGSNTWMFLEQELPFCIESGGYRRYRTIAETCTTYSFRKGSFTTDWYIRRLNLTWAVNFDVNGPS